MLYINLDLSCLLTPKSVLYYLILSGKWWLPKNHESVTQRVLIIICPLRITYLLIGGGSRLYTKLLALFSIHYFHIDHNASCFPPPPPQILHNHCFQFLLDITVVPREIQDNVYAKFGREGGGWVNKVHYNVMVYVKIVNSLVRGGSTKYQERAGHRETCQL